VEGRIFPFFSIALLAAFFTFVLGSFGAMGIFAQSA
jgi:hypothetical protein